MEYVFTYSRQQALEDGVLVDMNKYIPIEESGYKFPMACTEAVWNLISKTLENNQGMDPVGIVWDILHMSRYCKVKEFSNGVIFQVLIGGLSEDNLTTLKLLIGPGDNMEPVLTVMFPNED